MNTLIAISGLGIFCLIAEIFNLRKLIVPFTILVLGAILFVNLSEILTGQPMWGSIATNTHNMIVDTPFSRAFNCLFILLAIFIIAMSGNYYSNQPHKFSDYIAIKIFLLSGTVAMVSFGNLAMFFIGIEVMSIALYILAGSNRLNVKSNEAGMKYFLLGSFASGIMLFGICLVYGATGYFDIAEIYDLSAGAGLPVWFYIGVTMIVIGMLFKIAAFPFHFWAPDVYEGSPTIVTATMSTLVKVAAMATFFKLVTGLKAEYDIKYHTIIVVISIMTMFFGNIMALRQKNIKRMLAFSGISHAGFMLIAFVNTATSVNALYYYAFAYALSGIAAFAVNIYVTFKSGNEDIEAFNGFGKTNPLMAAVLTMSLLSMAGIPIFSGFFAKLMMFNQAIDAGYLILVIFGVINSIISIGYYFKLILAMYTKEPAHTEAKAFNIYTIVAVVAIVLNVLIGIFPNAITQLIK